MSKQYIFAEVLEKQRRFVKKSVGIAVAYSVWCEIANQFSLKDLCMRQYSLKHSSTSYRPADC